jgi:hypothetical protein
MVPKIVQFLTPPLVFLPLRWFVVVWTVNEYRHTLQPVALVVKVCLSICISLRPELRSIREATPRLVQEFQEFAFE